MGLLLQGPGHCPPRGVRAGTRGHDTSNGAGFQPGPWLPPVPSQSLPLSFLFLAACGFSKDEDTVLSSYYSRRFLNSSVGHTDSGNGAGMGASGVCEDLSG